MREECGFNMFYKRTGEILGQGSCGKVETCIHTLSGKQFAVKTVEKKTPGGYSRADVMKEIDIYHLCQGQPNIIQLIEYFEEEDKFELILEKICGGQLLQHIERRRSLTEAETKSIITSLAESLKFMHSRGIAHRDIKPENVLCVSNDAPNPVKLCDFDLCSKIRSTAKAGRLHTPVGSYDYMSPEVVKTFIGSSHYDEKCDLWSLGVLMYVLLCGYPPFSGRCGSECGWEIGEMCNSCEALLFFSIKEARFDFDDETWDEISGEAKDLISCLLEKDVSSRFDAQDVLNHPWIGGKGVSKVKDVPSSLDSPSSSMSSYDEYSSRSLRSFDESPTSSFSFFDAARRRSSTIFSMELDQNP